VYHVSFKSYIYSLEGEGQLEHFVDRMVGNFSEGRSGGFFFTTADRRYLVKTIGRKEQRRLLKMLPRYYEFLRTNPRSLLSRFSGCYCLTMHGQSRRFAVMENLFHAASVPASQLERYDLKGSWIGRSARRESGTRLDSDLQRKLHLPSAEAAQLAAQCQKDAEFLRSHNIMDYSLLVGIQHGYGSVDPLSSGSLPSLAASYRSLPSLPGVPSCGGPPKGSVPPSPTPLSGPLSTGSLPDPQPHQREPARQGAHSSLSLPDPVAEAADEEEEARADAPALSPSFLPHGDETSTEPAHDLEPTHFAADSPARAGSPFASASSALRLPPPQQVGAPARSRAGSVSEKRLRGPLAFSADPTADPGAVYYFAIIDLLQSWDWGKRLERCAKLLLCCRCCFAGGMSAVEPTTYARRFASMVERTVGPSNQRWSSTRYFRGF